MFSLIKKMLHRPTLEELAETPGSGIMNDKDFGMISYEPPSKDGEEGYWQMYNDWDLPESNAKLGCSAIPGDENGPFPEARLFLLSKRERLDDLWDFCHEELVKITSQWYPKDSDKAPKDIYYLSSMAMESSKGDEWEVSFEAKDKYLWTFASIQIKDNKIVGNTVDT